MFFGNISKIGQVSVYNVSLPLSVTNLNVNVNQLVWDYTTGTYQNGILQFKTSYIGLPYQHHFKTANNSINLFFDADGGTHSIQLIPSQNVTFSIDLYNSNSPSTDYRTLQPTQTFSYTFFPSGN